MPTISMFYGIVIRMFFRDNEKHHVPHIHVECQGVFAVYAIKTGNVLEGKLPPGKRKYVDVWIEMRRESLLENWELAMSGRPLQNIRGLD